MKFNEVVRLLKEFDYERNGRDITIMFLSQMIEELQKSDEMTKDEVISQLKELLEDRKSFLSGDEEDNKIYRADIEALEKSIEWLKGDER